MNRNAIVWVALVIAVGIGASGMYIFTHLPQHSSVTATSANLSANSNQNVAQGGGQSAGEGHGSQPSCTLSTGKKLYALGETVTFAWTASNADSVQFDEAFAGPSGSMRPPLPAGKYPSSGSADASASGTGYVVVGMKAYGPGGTSECQTNYYVGQAGVLQANPIASFGALPATITFTFVNQKSTSADATLAFTLVSTNSVGNADGSIANGHAILLVRDGSIEFPVYLSHNQPQQVVLARGTVTMTAQLLSKGSGAIISVK